MENIWEFSSGNLQIYWKPLLIDGVMYLLSNSTTCLCTPYAFEQVIVYNQISLVPSVFYMLATCVSWTLSDGSKGEQIDGFHFHFRFARHIDCAWHTQNKLTIWRLKLSHLGIWNYCILENDSL